jgi:hypothetical protein
MRAPTRGSSNTLDDLTTSTSIAPRIHVDDDAIERVTHEIPRRDLRGTSFVETS